MACALRFPTFSGSLVLSHFHSVVQFCNSSCGQWHSVHWFCACLQSYTQNLPRSFKNELQSLTVAFYCSYVPIWDGVHSRSWRRYWVLVLREWFALTVSISLHKKLVVSLNLIWLSVLFKQMTNRHMFAIHVFQAWRGHCTFFNIVTINLALAASKDSQQLVQSRCSCTVVFCKMSYSQQSDFYSTVHKTDSLKIHAHGIHGMSCCHWTAANGRKCQYCSRYIVKYIFPGDPFWIYMSKVKQSVLFKVFNLSWVMMSEQYVISIATVSIGLLVGLRSLRLFLEWATFDNIYLSPVSKLYFDMIGCTEYCVCVLKFVNCWDQTLGAVNICQGSHL